MTEEMNDFGFIAVTEDEVNSVETEKSEALQEQLNLLDKRLNAMYDAVLPLLDNLRKNPDADYIYWPDRVPKVDEFQQKLSDILYGVDE